jgi:hypothetical protein
LAASPPDYKGGKIPVVINIPGMDSFKEIGTFLYGDKYLTRGIAVLNLDGPGQYESAVLDIHFSMQSLDGNGHSLRGLAQ